MSNCIILNTKLNSNVGALIFEPIGDVRKPLARGGSYQYANVKGYFPRVQTRLD